VELVTGLASAGELTSHLGPALLAAQALREAYPAEPWLALVGLLHPLGRLLLHRGFSRGGLATWEVVGETFPVGCRFDPRVSNASWFGANPDRRKRLYGTPFGVYAPGCGLAEVDMCWSGDEYACEVLLRNRVNLPPAALFCLRYGSFHSLGTTPAGAYEQMMTPEEREALPWLRVLRSCKARVYSADCAQQAQAAEANAEELLKAFEPLIAAYMPGLLRL
jgi:inositol oxygenase